MSKMCRLFVDENAATKTDGLRYGEQESGSCQYHVSHDATAYSVACWQHHLGRFIGRWSSELSSPCECCVQMVFSQNLIFNWFQHIPFVEDLLAVVRYQAASPLAMSFWECVCLYTHGRILGVWVGSNPSK